MFTEIIITQLHSQRKKKSADEILKYFSNLFKKTGFYISYKLGDSLYEISNPVFWKTIIKLLSVEFALRDVKIKLETIS